MEYPALKTIVEAPTKVATVFFCNAPDRDKNSPTQLTEIPGTAILAKVNRKKKVIAIGIYKVNPL